MERAFAIACFLQGEFLLRLHVCLASLSTRAIFICVHFLHLIFVFAHFFVVTFFFGGIFFFFFFSLGECVCEIFFSFFNTEFTDKQKFGWW